MSIDTRVIRSEPHAEIGALIQRHAGTLVERWCRRAVEEQPNAPRVHNEVLRNELPAFLEAMGRSLIQAGNTEFSQHGEPALEHGEQRWDSGWSLTEVVRDYQLLQLVILEFLEQTLRRPLRYREVMAVGVFIDDAVAMSIATYTANRDLYMHQIKQERADASQEANRRKDEFLAILAHELRNPLAPIQSSVKVLHHLLGTADAPVLKALNVVDRQSRQLTRMVDDLLDVTRIAQGRLELRRTRLNLAAVLEQAVQTSEPIFKARNHELTVSLPPDPVYLDADPARLVQIVVNLLNNAGKYTDPGGRVWLSATRDGEQAVIRVRDNGVGIPATMLSRIFDLYTQGDGSQQRSPGGLGIGLSLVRRLVELHGGSVTCYSPGRGQGSEFVVRLPALSGAVEVSSPEPPAASAPVAPCHLLIVEDHADARDMLATLLGLMGHRVDVAENGLRGVERALAVRPQVALIDIGLPDVNGYEVARQLRVALADGIFLVALTGYGQSDDLRQALDAGFNAHLVKPANLDELTRLLAGAPGAVRERPR
jgi:signal transduction histidine kinase/ActR/RegA family two-component response regulator